MNFTFQKEAVESEKKLNKRERAVVRMGLKHYLGHERREGWKGELPFYLFLCDECGSVTKDYPHGYLNGRYLNCAKCGAYHSFVPWWVPFVELWHIICSCVRIRRTR